MTPAAPNKPEDPRLADLQATLAARQGKPGYARNAIAIQAEIDRLVKERDQP